jgi:hypothetical protein
MATDSIEPSVAMREHLKKAREAIAEYEAQQQIIILLLERLGGSATFNLESLVTRRHGVISVHQDETTGATTIAFTPKAEMAA